MFLFSTWLSSWFTAPGIVFDRSSETLPQIVIDSIAFIEEHGLKSEGVFRLSGGSEEVKNLKKAYEKGKPPSLSTCSDVHIVTSLLKLFFRELPEPLLTFELYDSFMASVVETQREAAIRKVVNLLPPGNRVVLKSLIQLLTKIIKFKDLNKMSPQNLAIVFAPTLMRTPTETFELILRDSPKRNDLIEAFITHYNQIFEDGVGGTPEGSASKGAESVSFNRTLKVGTVRLATVLLKEKEWRQTMTDTSWLPPHLQPNYDPNQTDNAENENQSLGDNTDNPVSSTLQRLGPTQARASLASASTPSLGDSSPSSSPSLRNSNGNLPASHPSSLVPPAFASVPPPPPLSLPKPGWVGINNRPGERGTWKSGERTASDSTGLWIAPTRMSVSSISFDHYETEESSRPKRRPSNPPPLPPPRSSALHSPSAPFLYGPPAIPPPNLSRSISENASSYNTLMTDNFEEEEVCENEMETLMKQNHIISNENSSVILPETLSELSEEVLELADLEKITTVYKTGTYKDLQNYLDSLNQRQ